MIVTDDVISYLCPFKRYIKKWIYTIMSMNCSSCIQFVFGIAHLHYTWDDQWDVMTSSNGNIFHGTSPLSGEFTSHRFIPLTKASYAKLWCFPLICAWINGWVNNREAGDLRPHRAHYVVIVMSWEDKNRLVFIECRTRKPIISAIM